MQSRPISSGRGDNSTSQKVVDNQPGSSDGRQSSSIPRSDGLVHDHVRRAVDADKQIQHTRRSSADAWSLAAMSSFHTTAESYEWTPQSLLSEVASPQTTAISVVSDKSPSTRSMKSILRRFSGHRGTFEQSISDNIPEMLDTIPDITYARFFDLEKHFSVAMRNIEDNHQELFGASNNGFYGGDEDVVHADSNDEARTDSIKQYFSDDANVNQYYQDLQDLGTAFFAYSADASAMNKFLGVKDKDLAALHEAEIRLRLGGFQTINAVQDHMNSSFTEKVAPFALYLDFQGSAALWQLHVVERRLNTLATVDTHVGAYRSHLPEVLMCFDDNKLFFDQYQTLYSQARQIDQYFQSRDIQKNVGDSFSVHNTQVAQGAYKEASEVMKQWRDQRPPVQNLLRDLLGYPFSFEQFPAILRVYRSNDDADAALPTATKQEIVSSIERYWEPLWLRISRPEPITLSFDNKSLHKVSDGDFIAAVRDWGMRCSSYYSGIQSCRLTVQEYEGFHQGWALLKKEGIFSSVVESVWRRMDTWSIQLTRLDTFANHTAQMFSQATLPASSYQQYSESLARAAGGVNNLRASMVALSGEMSDLIRLPIWSELQHENLASSQVKLREMRSDLDGIGQQLSASIQHLLNLLTIAHNSSSQRV